MKNNKNKENDLKNCKIKVKNMKNGINIAKKCTEKKNIKNLCVADLRLLALIKTLICVHDYLPNIIKVVDDTISNKASSTYDGSFIFGDLKDGTFGQIEKVINLSNRKISLVNLYSLVNTMVDSLSKKQKELVKLKFYKHKKTEYIAEEFEVDERTIFRWTNEALLELLRFCKNSNWSFEFLCSQIEQEGWLYEHYKRHYANLLNNVCK